MIDGVFDTEKRASPSDANEKGLIFQRRVGVTNQRGILINI